MTLPSRHDRRLDRRARRDAGERRDARRPTWSSSASACGRRRRWRNRAGLAIDRGVTVDEYLANQRARHLRGRRHRALARSAHAASASASSTGSWPSARDRPRRATCSGQRERFDAVPFFWTEQYDFGLAYVGHAERWDRSRSTAIWRPRDCTITYRRAGRKLAVAVVHRDLEGPARRGRVRAGDRRQRTQTRAEPIEEMTMDQADRRRQGQAEARLRAGRLRTEARGS